MIGILAYVEKPVDPTLKYIILRQKNKVEQATLMTPFHFVLIVTIKSDAIRRKRIIIFINVGHYKLVHISNINMYSINCYAE